MMRGPILHDLCAGHQAVGVERKHQVEAGAERLEEVAHVACL